MKFFITTAIACMLASSLNALSVAYAPREAVAGQQSFFRYCGKSSETPDQMTFLFQKNRFMGMTTLVEDEIKDYSYQIMEPGKRHMFRNPIRTFAGDCFFVYFQVPQELDGHKYYIKIRNKDDDKGGKYSEPIYIIKGGEIQTAAASGAGFGAGTKGPVPPRQPSVYAGFAGAQARAGAMAGSVARHSQTMFNGARQRFSAPFQTSQTKDKYAQAGARTKSKGSQAEIPPFKQQKAQSFNEIPYQPLRDGGDVNDVYPPNYYSSANN
ncbi:hypothetical protein MIR68_000572 [Amoeboaphelidium protococcarum]|nr:hypothetical protein MIR68_000572 [Amoeboaphelidium protococcarum]